MSDYLTRVVERTVGQPAVRPLVAPLFAPGPGSAAAGPAGAPAGRTDGEATHFTHQTAPDTDRAACRGNAAHRPAAVVEERETAQHEPPSSLSSPAPRQPVPGPVPAAARPPGGIESLPSAPESLPGSVDIRRGNGQAATEAPAAAEPSGLIPAALSGSGITNAPQAGHETFERAFRSVRRREERQSSDPLMEEGAGRSGPAGDGDAAAETGREALVPPPSPDGILPRRLQHGDEPFLRVVGEGAPAVSGDSALPTIKISIGRIDVRAVAPPPTPQKAAQPPTPKVSLDDYLRKQSGGAR